MFYKQSVDDIKLVILSLDGGLLDLNRLRFNYLNKICTSNNIKITKEEFEKSLGNMNTMYINLPITNIIAPDDLNNLIERDLYEYAKLKPNSLIKEGAEDILQFLRQKDIKIAVISSHKIKRAIQYLQLTRLYNLVDFIIGGDSNNLPLPDPSLLKITLTQLGVEAKNALVVAPYPNLLYAANRKFLNVVYLNDLCLANNAISSSAYKVAKNNLDVINILLFSRYDTMEMYSPLLGMSSDMPLHALKHTYQRLLKEYSSDPQLIDLVNNTYQYFLNEILENNQSYSTTALFEEDESDNNNKNSDTIEIKEEKKLQPSKRFNFSDESQATINATNKFVKDDPEHLNKLMDVINGTNVDNNEPIHSTETKPKRSITKTENTTFLEKITNFLYVLTVTSLVSFAGLLGYVAFQDFINGNSLFASLIKKLIIFYTNAIETFYTLILDFLHHFLNFIPSYNQLVAGNDNLSTLAIQLILAIIFNLIIVYLFKYIFLLLTEDDDEDILEN